MIQENSLTPVRNSSQIDKVVELAQEIWTEHFTPIIGLNQVNYMLAKFQSVKAITKQISDESFEYFLIENENIPVGYTAIQAKSNGLYLSKLYVKLSARGKGLGKFTIKFIENLAKEKKLPKITLNVNRNNTNSIKAYEKMGFVKSDTVNIDIGEGYAMCDYVMEKTIN